MPRGRRNGRGVCNDRLRLSVAEGVFCCSGLVGYSIDFLLSLVVDKGASNRSISVNKIHMKRARKN